MNQKLLTELNDFLGRASKATYAGGGSEVRPWRKGFKELDYREDNWYYRDSYSGFLRSWGQEVVWRDRQPIWTCLYGGGMTEHHMDSDFANETFTFLKKALSAGEKEALFQPRGPEIFDDDRWHYRCELDGDITKFNGHESIRYDNEVVFTHTFTGGLVIGSSGD